MDGLENLTNAEKIQIVKNTIGMLNIAPTEENTTLLAGIYRVLTEVRDDLAEPLREAPEEEEDGREADAE